MRRAFFSVVLRFPVLFNPPTFVASPEFFGILPFPSGHQSDENTFVFF